MPSRFRIPNPFGRRDGCAELRKLASDYLEADISEEMRDRIRRHLEQCGNCDRFIETLRSTISMLGELPAKPIPANLKDRVLRVSEQRSQGH